MTPVYKFLLKFFFSVVRNITGTDQRALTDKVKRVHRKYLLDGQHIAVPRQPVGEDVTGQGFYTYLHHGIVCKAKHDGEVDRVITFTVPPDVNETDGLQAVVYDAQLKDFRMTTEYGVKNHISRHLLNAAAFVADNTLGKNNAVYYETIDVFAEADGMVIPYEYCATIQPDTPFGPTQNPLEAHAKSKALAVAQFFVQDEARQKLFGTYSLTSWNCEHFATFCSTTDLQVADLERAFRQLGQGESALSREYLEHNSNALCVALYRYEQVGPRAIFMQDLHAPV